MSPKKQRIAIAEACGVKCKRCKGEGFFLRYGPHEWFRVGNGADQPFVKCDHVSALDFRHFSDYTIPDYLNDLNAIHEAKTASLTTYQLKDRFARIAYDLIKGSFTDWYQNLNFENVYSLTNLTASQQSESLLRTLGKWEESE